MPRPHKYRAKRTEYNGVMYASKAEALRAAELDALGYKWQGQMTFSLGPDHKWRLDFVVSDDSETWVEDIKGFETSDFKRHVRLWKKYGIMPLVILKRRGKGWIKTVIRGGMEKRP